jgi:hypothetical protein
MSFPLLPKNVEISKLKYSEVKTLSSGSKSVYVNYATGKLRIQTPVLFMPYGIGEGYEDKSVKNPEVKKNIDKKYDLTVSFKGHDENPKILAFLEKMREIEQEIIDKAFDYRLEWFKDDYDGNKAFVARMFSQMIKVDKDPKTGKPVGKYPPTLKVKVPYDGLNDKFKFDCYDMENNEIEFTNIISKLKGGKTQLIIELTGIWMAGGKYGCTWKIVSSKFQLSQSNKMAFIEDSDTEKKDAEEEDEEEEEEDEPSLPKQENKVENSDDDDNEDDEGEKKEVVEDKKEQSKGGRGRKPAAKK